MPKFKFQIKSKAQISKFWILEFDIDLVFACLREAPPCGAKAGILTGKCPASPAL
jgi:hypothetical protein